MNLNQLYDPMIYSNKTYNQVKILNKYFLNEDTYEGFDEARSIPFADSKYCQVDFKIPLLEDFKEVIDTLGSKAYSTFTDKNRFNIIEGKYYLTNTGGKKYRTSKMILYLNWKSLKFLVERTFSIDVIVRCMLNIPNANIVSKFKERDIDLNEKIMISAENKYLSGYLWKIDNNTFTTESFEYTFDIRKEYKIEFWGEYINSSDVYLYDIIHVNKKQISSCLHLRNEK